MTKKIKAPTECEYIVRCQITRRTEVIVIAASEEEAISKFEAMEWESEVGEIIDFTRDGKVKVNA